MSNDKTIDRMAGFAASMAIVMVTFFVLGAFTHNHLFMVGVAATLVVTVLTVAVWAGLGVSQETRLRR